MGPTFWNNRSLNRLSNRLLASESNAYSSQGFSVGIGYLVLYMLIYPYYVLSAWRNNGTLLVKDLFFPKAEKIKDYIAFSSVVFVEHVVFIDCLKLILFTF